MASPTDKEAEIQELRQSMLKDTEALATKQRFALFSSPVPLGLGDNSYDFKKRPPRGENRKPITEAPNVKVSNPKSGRIKSSYFSVMNYTSIGDPYMDPSRKDLQYELEKKKNMLYKDQIFKPQNCFKELNSGAYVHMQDYDSRPTKNRKMPDGRVYSAPRNVTTNQQNRDLLKGYPHMKDEYARKAEHDRKMQEEAKKKEKPEPFRSTVYGGENFNRDVRVFGQDRPMPPLSAKKPVDLKSMKHPEPFKPSNPPKKSWQGNLNKLVYKGDPEGKTKRREWSKTKESFKPNNLGTLTRPTPTISCFKTNIRRQMSAKGF